MEDPTFETLWDPISRFEEFGAVALLLLAVAGFLFMVAEPATKAKVVGVVAGLFVAFWVLSALAGHWGWVPLLMFLLSVATPPSLGVTVHAFVRDWLRKASALAITLILLAGLVWTFVVGWPVEWWQVGLVVAALVSAGYVAYLLAVRREEADRERSEQARKRHDLEQQRREANHLEQQRQQEQARLSREADDRSQREREGAKNAKRAREKADEEARQKAEIEQLWKTQHDESSALSEAAEHDRGMSLDDIRHRQRLVLEKVFEEAHGAATGSVALTDLAERLDLTPGQILRALKALDSRGLVQTNRRYPRRQWTDQSASLTKRGAELAAEKSQELGAVHIAGSVGSLVAGGGQGGSVSIGAVGTNNTVTDSSIGEGPGEMAFAVLLEAVRSVRDQLVDANQVAVLDAELKVLEGASDELARRSAADRLVGISAILGQVASPILDAANSFKDLIS